MDGLLHLVQRVVDNVASRPMLVQERPQDFGWGGGSAPLPSEAKKILKISLWNGAFWSISE